MSMTKQALADGFENFKSVQAAAIRIATRVFGVAPTHIYGDRTVLWMDETPGTPILCASVENPIAPTEYWTWRVGVVLGDGTPNLFSGEPGVNTSWAANAIWHRHLCKAQYTELREVTS